MIFDEYFTVIVTFPAFLALIFPVFVTVAIFLLELLYVSFFFAAFTFALVFGDTVTLTASFFVLPFFIVTFFFVKATAFTVPLDVDAFFVVDELLFVVEVEEVDAVELSVCPDNEI